MTPDEYKWYINLVKERYHTLDLTFEQAEKVYRYEQDKEIYSDKHYFSVWEEWDYERTIFKQILNDEQFKTYETNLNESIQQYGQRLIEQDKENSNEIAYQEALIDFYETQFLPEFFKDPFMRFGWLLSDKAKVEYLRAEYKNYLNDTKKEMLTNHFRHNRTFKPNDLKLWLLRYKLYCVFPNYHYFKIKMDEPTKAVAHFINTKLHLPDHIDELLIRKLKELQDFSEANFKKYYNDTRGWHVIGGQQTDEEKKENRAMSLLLLDEGKYGFTDTI